ncbi:MAG TPA: DUF5615 family PIN-like protein [Micromonospora sp.]|nr:DUF5615 family PIN-like protein [Micromonospora sp.]
MAELLVKAGHDAVHVIERELAGCTDAEVLAHAVSDGRVLLSADTDFGELLAVSQGVSPSVILIRRSVRRPEAVASVILANLDQVAQELASGAFVVITDQRVRLRLLPLG